ncbi:UNVERIFIED_CONTAM: Cro/Cl family transcriptional regulator, partial [Salmonella enterica subsp. enterica serovar Weltevreden]
RAVFGDLSGEASVSIAEVKALAANMPAAARAIVDLHRRQRAAAERADLLAAQLGDDGRAPRWRAASNEEVRDYLNRRQNHVA